MRVVILAGGQGLRLRPLTEDRPKSMVTLGSRPVAEVQLSWLKKNTELELVVFACGPRWQKLKEYFGSEYQNTPIEYVVEEQPLGTGGAIRNVIERLNGREWNDNILVLNGDIITDLPLGRMIESHHSSQTLVTMLLVPYRSPYGVVRIDKLKMVRKFEEKPEFIDAWINGGVYLMQSKKIAGLLPEQGDIERETFPRLVQYGEIAAYPYYGFWRSLDSIKDLREVEHELLTVRTEA